MIQFSTCTKATCATADAQSSTNAEVVPTPKLLHVAHLVTSWQAVLTEKQLLLRRAHKLSTNAEATRLAPMLLLT